MDDGGHVGLALNLWQKNRSRAMMALYHPFVVSLAAGTLNIQTFRHYIAQDAFFLQAFATAYRLALENVDDDVSKLLINQLLQAALDELKLHSSYAKDWGVDLTKESKPNNATVKYTEFLLATAAVLKKDIPGQEGTFLDRRKLAALTIGAMTPCMRLYAFLGQEIAKILDENCWVTPYHEWVDTYSAEAFQASTLQIERLLENLAGPLGEDDIQHLENLYCQALSLELEFFSAQPDCQCALVPFIRRQSDSSDFFYLLMSDFDLTCSMTDSCPALANVSVEAATNKEKEHVSSMCHKSSLELRRTWDLLEKSYSDQYTTILTLPEYTENSHRCYDHDGLRSFLERLSRFEIQSNFEVIKKGVFKGLDMEEVRKAGGEMSLQEGCSNFFRQVSMLSNVKTHIISVCWSKAYIEGALSKGGIHSVQVHSNELSTSGSYTTGDIIRAVESPLDKERVFEEIRKDLKDLSRPVLTVYIGDSLTDLLCLVKSDLGIVVGSSSTLRRVTQAFGVSLVPLYKGTLENVKSGGPERWQRSEGVLYTVTSWHEIFAFMAGISDPQHGVSTQG